MLTIGRVSPRPEAWSYTVRDLVDLTPWRFAIPVAITLFSSVVFLYLLFSNVGLVGGLSAMFWPLVAALVAGNGFVWWRATRAVNA